MYQGYLERFAPKTLSACILSEENRHALENQVKRNLPNSLYFYGEAGMGKTATAIAYCNDAGLSYEHIDGAQYATQKEVNDLIRIIAPDYDGYGYEHPVISGERANGRAFIIDEVDRITEGVQKRLLGTLSRLHTFSTVGSIKKVIFCSNERKATPAFDRRVVDLCFDKEILMKEMVIALLETVDKEAGNNSRHALDDIFTYHFTNPKGGIAQMLDEMETGHRKRY